MEGQAATEELDRLLDAVLPAVVRDSAVSEGGRLYRTVMGRVEMPLLRLALELSAGNQLKAARLLGINRNTLRKRLRLLGLLPAAHASPHGAKSEESARGGAWGGAGKETRLPAGGRGQRRERTAG